MKSKKLFKISLSIFSCGTSVYLAKRYWIKQLNDLQQKMEKLQDHYGLLNHWLELKNEGKTVASYFEEMGFYHIGIYGMSDLANRLMEDLEGSNICIDYGIDQDVCCSSARIAEVYSLEDELPRTDVIVITPYSAFGSIKTMLKERVDCPVISLEEIVWSI